MLNLRLPMSGLMVVGIDIYRNKGSGKDAKMIAGVVCSLNNGNTQFYSQVVFEEQGKNFRQAIIEGKDLVTAIFGQAQTIQSISNRINMNSDRIPNF
jgi:hypothetical protein